MYKRSVLPTVFVVLFPLFLVGQSADQVCQSTDKILLTGSGKGYYYKLGKALAQVARSEGLNLCVQTTEHNLDNVSELDAGHAVFGIAQSDVAHDAWYGHPWYNHGKKFQKPVTNVRLVMTLYVEGVHIMLRPHLNIAHLGHLESKTVGVGLADSGTEYTAKHILAAVGLQSDGSAKNFEAVNTTDPKLCHSVQLLMTGTLDALFKVTVVPSVDIQDTLKQNPDPRDAEESGCAQAWEIRLLPLDHEFAERLVRDGRYHETLSQKKDYAQPTSDLTLAGQALLLADKDASGAAVEQLARVIRVKGHAIATPLEAIIALQHPVH